VSAVRKAALAVFVLAAAAFAWVYAFHGLYGLHVVILRGGSIWPRVTRDDPRLTEAVRLSLAGAHPVGGAVNWKQRAPSFESGEMPLLIEGREIDEILLARIDPTRWNFSVFNHPSGDRNVDDWSRALGAALVVNGSYYDQYGVVDTPFRSAGVDLGPKIYDGTHGAFVASEKGAEIVDLKTTTWRDAFGPAHDALVSYPLLLDESGATRATSSDWLANRSFLAQDRAGRVVIGTTRDASLRLIDLARVLKDSDLDLKRALNLDGGPVACQSIILPGFRRRTCGTMEVQANGDEIRLLQPVFGHWDWALPVVLTVTAKPGG